jgi:hypothetical protein
LILVLKTIEGSVDSVGSEELLMAALLNELTVR